MRPEQGGAEFVVQRLLRVVVTHRDLLEYHAALQLDVRRIEPGVAQHIADQVDGEVEITVEYVRVVAGVFLGGERVELSADCVDLFGNRRRGTPRGALEQQMFEVMRRTGHHGGHIPRADRNPHPHRGRARTGQVLGHYS